MFNLSNAPLGKKTGYADHYNPDLLFPIPREKTRANINLGNKVFFYGFDIWNAYELSWLNSNGKPQVALAEFIFPCESLNLVESKSLKLYLNSMNNTKFNSPQELIAVLEKDLSQKADALVTVKFFSHLNIGELTIENFSGICLDDLDIHCDTYQVTPELLSVDKEQIVEEILYSHLLKSNCLITGQPDFGSIQIKYSGKKINKENLLKYLISFRNHNEFHEQCAERIFLDIIKYCQPKKLTIHARYTRRGGIDINIIRSTEKNIELCNKRLYRQ